MSMIFKLCALWFSLALWGPLNAAGTEKLLKSVPLQAARWMTTDASGNVYIISANNSLLKLSSSGDSVNYYQSIANGNLTWVDASNPLRIMLFYPDYMKLIFLDRMMGYTSEVDLKQLNIFNTNAVGVSQDGNIWVYDYNNALLKKIDMDGNIILTGNDVRMESGVVPDPQSLMEMDKKVYLIDTSRGIFIFDRYGGYLNQIPVTGEKDVLINGNQYVFYKDGMFVKYDLLTGNTSELALKVWDTEMPIHARLQNGRAYLLFENKIDIYGL